MVVLGLPSIVRIMTNLPPTPGGGRRSDPAPARAGISPGTRSLKSGDGGGTYPGYHTRKVAASDHLPRGDMTGTVFLTG
jgi:hypothetical protein